MKFAVGAKVKWRSQAAGSAVVKVGRVVEVVAATKQPRLYATIGSRPHESYVVEAQAVIAGSSRRPVKLGKVQVYWPNVSALRAWNGEITPAGMRVPR